jgi:hypothetical protein
MQNKLSRASRTVTSDGRVFDISPDQFKAIVLWVTDRVKEGTPDHLRPIANWILYKVLEQAFEAHEVPHMLISITHESESIQ